MTYTLLFRASAERDLGEARAYHAEHGQGDAFLASIDRSFEQLAERPLMYPVAYQSVRRALVRRFPYSIFFVVEDARVIVLGVHHHRRDPAGWPRR
jgi:plasmid stabilization system protein ParE